MSDNDDYFDQDGNNQENVILDWDLFDDYNEANNLLTSEKKNFCKSHELLPNQKNLNVKNALDDQYQLKKSPGNVFEKEALIKNNNYEKMYHTITNMESTSQSNVMYTNEKDITNYLRNSDSDKKWALSKDLDFDLLKKKFGDMKANSNFFYLKQKFQVFMFIKVTT